MRGRRTITSKKRLLPPTPHFNLAAPPRTRYTFPAPVQHSLLYPLSDRTFASPPVGPLIPTLSRRYNPRQNTIAALCPPILYIPSLSIRQGVMIT
jgi:hypothetical protein